MFRNRLSEQQDRRAWPQAGGLPLATGNFIFCPVGLLGCGGPGLNGWQSSLYQLALEQAQATVQTPPPDRRLFANWN